MESERLSDSSRRSTRSPAAVEPDDPMTLQRDGRRGRPRRDDPRLVQEYAWMGWDAGQIAALFRDPFYPMLHGLWLTRSARPASASASTPSSTAAASSGSGPRSVEAPDESGPERRPDRHLEAGGESPWPTVYNWQLGRAMAYPLRGEAPAPAVRLRLQHQPLHRLPDLHHGVQEHLDLLEGPGVHVVEQRRVEALRRLPPALGREAAGDARGRQPRRPVVGRAPTADGEAKPYGTFEGKTIFEAAADPRRPRRGPGRARLPAHRRRVAAPQHPRGHRHRRPVGRGPASAARRNCPSTASGSSTWRGSATTAPTPAASPPARGRRSTSGPRTASC